MTETAVPTAQDWSPEMYTYLDALAKLAARQVAPRFPQAEFDDLHQEALMWAVAHPERLQGLLDDEDEKRCSRGIQRAMENAARRYARKVRALTRAGDNRDPLSDDVFYPTGLLKGDRGNAGLLRLIWDDQAWLSPETNGEQVRSTPGDPAEGNNWLATLADVSRAFSLIPEEDRDLLEAHFRWGQTYESIGQAFTPPLSKQTVSKRIDRAIRKVQDVLGGPRPYKDPPEDGWENGLVGTRRAITNSHARALTDGGYDG